MWTYIVGHYAYAGDTLGLRSMERVQERLTARGCEPRLPSEEAPGSAPLGQLVSRPARRVAVAVCILVQAHQIVQKVHLRSVWSVLTALPNLHSPGCGTGTYTLQAGQGYFVIQAVMLDM